VVFPRGNEGFGDCMGNNLRRVLNLPAIPVICFKVPYNSIKITEYPCGTIESKYSPVTRKSWLKTCVADFNLFAVL
jgi:hypothetical protein